jgi:uncharacterized protein involved in exopolysaccharide biosynthesis
MDRGKSLDSDNQQFKVLNFIGQFLVYRWIIIIITIVGTAIAITIAFLLPKQYLTVASIKSSGGSGFDISSVFKSTGVGGGLGSLMDLAMPSGGGDVDYLYSLLSSRTILDSMIVKFNLKERYDNKFIEDTRDALFGNMFIEVNYPAGLIYFGVYSETQMEAAQMTNSLIYYLNYNYSRLNSEIGKNNRINLEKRYKEILTDLELAEDTLTRFQEAYGVLEPTIQTEVSLRTAADLKLELMLKEIEANTKAKFFGANSPQVLIMMEQISELQSKYDQFLIGVEKKGKTNDFFLPFKQTPQLAMQYFKLFRDVEIGSEILKVIIPLIENAKIQELRETPNLLILDNGTIPEKKSKPKRMIIALIGFGLSLSVALIFAWIKINLDNIKKTNPEAYKRLQLISHMIIPKFKFRK